jgi:hypothetical protein
MKPVFDGDRFYSCESGRTAIGIEPCAVAHRRERFVQQRISLHDLCLRARSREDVDPCAAALKEIDATIVRGPEEGSWAPGYNSILFEIRTASAWKCPSFPERACFRPVRRSTPKMATAGRAKDQGSRGPAVAGNVDGWQTPNHTSRLTSPNGARHRCVAEEQGFELPIPLAQR